MSPSGPSSTNLVCWHGFPIRDLVILSTLLLVVFSSCTSTLPKSATKIEGGFQRITFGTFTLDYYADYIFPPRPSELYPPREIALWENLGILEAEWMMCTKLDPYMASTIHSSELQSKEELELQLTNAGVRNLYMEIPEQEQVHAYARYQIISRQYPIRTNVVEYLVGEGEGNYFRVVFYSNEAGDNMKEEGWKIIGTLGKKSAEVE